MDKSINEVLNLDENEFNALPTVIKLMEPKIGRTKYLRFVFCEEFNCEIVVDPLYKPISKMIEYESQ